MKAKVICTTILVEKSPQALPLGAACIASSLKHSPLTKDLCSVKLKTFTLEDKEIMSKSVDQAASFIVNELNEDFVSDFSSDKGDRDNLFDKGDRDKSSINESKKIICFSVFVWNRLIFEECARLLKRDGVICIAGGPEVTASPKTFSAFDYLVCGQGEFSVPYLVKNLLTEELKKQNYSVTFDIFSNSNNDSVTFDKNPVPLTSSDFDLSISPYLDGTIDISKYDGVLWELARGCPFKCSYCYESRGEKKVRLIPKERIEKELELFAEKKVSQVFVLDPTYNVDKKRAIELLSLIQKKTPDTFYYFEARAEFIDRNLARAFTKIPCALQIGLQSADENVLKKVNRPFNRNTFIKNIGILNEEGVVFGFDLIYGLPGESFKGFKKGIDFAISLYPNNLEIFCLSVLPGTDLYDRAEELHLTFEDKAPYHIIKTDCISESELKKARLIADSCCLFYNEGRAVPWFNSLCHSLNIKPSNFFERFSDYMKSHQTSHLHSEIEKVQKDFVKLLYSERNLQKYLSLALDVIAFYGALSRVQDSGKEEIVSLKYPAEYIDSEYASDFLFFVKNVRPKTCSIRIFKNGHFAQWRYNKRK